MVRKKMCLLSLLVTLIFVGAWCTPSASAAPIKMRVQTAAPNVSLSYKSVVWLADAVREMSNGRLEIEVLPAGAIVPTARIPSAVDKGLVEAGATYAQYLAGKHMAGALFGARPRVAGAMSV